MLLGYDHCTISSYSTSEQSQATVEGELFLVVLCVVVPCCEITCPNIMENVVVVQFCDTI